MAKTKADLETEVMTLTAQLDQQKKIIEDQKKQLEQLDKVLNGLQKVYSEKTKVLYNALATFNRLVSLEFANGGEQ